MSDSALRRYTDFFEQLNADNLDQLASVMTEDVHFVDPFNDVRGLARVEQVFRHMYASLQDPEFRVSHAAMAAGEEPRGLLLWELNSKLSGKPYRIAGMSVVAFSPDGRVCSHIDHWDASRQFYERLPVIGWLLKSIRARLAV